MTPEWEGFFRENELRINETQDKIAELEKELGDPWIQRVNDDIDVLKRRTRKIDEIEKKLDDTIEDLVQSDISIDKLEEFKHMIGDFTDIDFIELRTKVNGIYKSVHGIEPNDADRIWKEISELKEAIEQLRKWMDVPCKCELEIKELKEDFKIKRESDRMQINANLDGLNDVIDGWRIHDDVLREFIKFWRDLCEDQNLDNTWYRSAEENYQKILKKLDGEKESNRRVLASTANVKPENSITDSKPSVRSAAHTERERVWLKCKNWDDDWCPTLPEKCNEKCKSFEPKEKPSEPTASSASHTECEHRWTFQDPEGMGHSRAFCKKCGYLRDSMIRTDINKQRAKAEALDPDLEYADDTITREGIETIYPNHKLVAKDDLKHWRRLLEFMNSDDPDDYKAPVEALKKGFEKYLSEGE